MAESILHSGSFVDRNGDEITITFFTKSTSNMTVNKNTLNFASTSGSTDTVQVSGYTGSVNVSKPSWLSYTVSTSSGRKTYTFTTASANTSGSQRSGNITFTDNNGSVTVSATQAAAVVSLAVNPNTLTFNSNGETKTTSITFSGSTGVPTYSNDPDWVSVSLSGSTSPITLSVNAGPNTTGGNRSHTMYINYGSHREDLILQQDSAHSVSVQPNAFTGQYEFPASGGTQQLTISDIQGSFSMNYSGEGLSLELIYTSETGSIRMYNVTYTANPVTAARTGVINVRDSAGVWVAIPTSQAASAAAFAVSPTSFEYAGSGATNTFTFTGVPSGGIGYSMPASAEDWVSISNFSNASVDITAAASSLPTSRSAVVTFYDLDDNSNYVTVTVNQEAGVDSLTLSKSSISVGPAATHDGFTATWTAGTEPTATIVYVQGDPGWLSQSASVSGNQKVFTLAFTSNYDASSRTALVRVTNGLQTETVSISQSSGPSPAVLSVLPSSMDFYPMGQRKSAVVSNISGTLTYNSGKPEWITINESGSGGTRLLSVIAASNSTGVSRSGTITINDDANNPATIAVTQVELQVLSVNPNSISYPYTLSTSNVTVTYPSEYGVTTSINYLDGSGWIDGVELVSTSGSVRTYCIDVSSNPGTSAREAEVDFIGEYGGTDTVTVTQDGTTDYVTPSSLTFVGAGETKNYTCTYPSNWALRITYHRGSGWLSYNYGPSYNITANRNTTSYNRTATIEFYDTNNNVVIGTIEVTQYVEAIGVSPSQMTVGPTKANTQYIDYYQVGISAWTYPVTVTTSETWLSVVRTNYSSFRVYTSTNYGSIARTGTIAFNVNDQSGVCTITQRSGELDTDKQNLDYGYSGGTQSIDITYDTSLSLSYPSWITMSCVSTSGDGEANPFVRTYDVTTAANTSTSSRSGYISCSTPYESMSVPVSQNGIPTISVSPSSIDFPHTVDAETLTVSGISANGFSCSLSYADSNITNWLSLTTTAYNIIVTANSQNIRPGSRYATLTVTNSSDPTDSVQVPIRQYGNPGSLSVTPNAYTYPATLSTHTFTVIYSASGNITPVVTYQREEGEEEIDWLSVELVDHEEGSETWLFDIDCGPNSGQVREAMVEFDGDGGGADEVVVTQLGQA